MKHIFGAAMLASVTLGGGASAQDTKPLDATASNPVTMGWMQGFPPAAESYARKLVTV